MFIDQRRTKTKYMDWNFSVQIQSGEATLRIEAQEKPQTDSFHYLGSIMSGWRD